MWLISNYIHGDLRLGRRKRKYAVYGIYHLLHECEKPHNLEAVTICALRETNKTGRGLSLFIVLAKQQSDFKPTHATTKCKCNVVKSEYYLDTSRMKRAVVKRGRRLPIRLSMVILNPA